MQSVVGKSSTSLALAVEVHSSSDGLDLEVDAVGGTAADEAVKQNGDLGDHAARGFIDQAVKQKGDSGNPAALMLKTRSSEGTRVAARIGLDQLDGT